MAEYIDGIVDTLGNNLELVDTQARTDIAQINNSLTKKTTTLTVPNNQYSVVSYNQVEKSGNIVIVRFGGNLSSTIAGLNALIATLPEGYRPSSTAEVQIFTNYAQTTPSIYHATIYTDGTIKTNIGGSTVSDRMYINVMFCI